MGLTLTAQNVLWTALRNKRPDNGSGIKLLINRIRCMAPEDSQSIDGIGNLWIDLRADETNRTLFIAHLDTVHVKDGPVEIYLSGDNKVHTSGKDVLGADDGAGIAMLAHLINHGIPALYVFTQNEERGGTGARYIATKDKRKLDNLDRCIAFDRKGKLEICGEQMIGNCASPAFVDALAVQLAMGHAWGSGTYTDNSEFRGIIPEIVNVSVGYESNHGPNETLDMDYLDALADAVLTVDWDNLPVVGPEPDDDRWSGLYGSVYSDRWTSYGWVDSKRTKTTRVELTDDDIAEAAIESILDVFGYDHRDNAEYSAVQDIVYDLIYKVGSVNSNI